WAEFVVVSDEAFRSEPASIDINYYNTGREAGARGGRRLSEGFGTWGDRPEDYTILRVRGEINNEDLQFLGSLPVLTALELVPDQIESSCDYALAGSRIEALSLNIAPSGMLKGMERLTTVVWDGDNDMPDGILAENGNPNIMLWLKDKSKAPADARNIVTYEYNGEGIPQGADVTGHSELISLYPGFPFKVHTPLKAEHIELSKDFTQTTEIGVCRGWETIALPFSPTLITHETRGEIVPFASWGGDDYCPRPFWLYESNSNGWTAADGIKAGMPYIISMPNNEEYLESYNLPGRVTFSAEDVELTPESTIPDTTDWVDNSRFVATFMPVEDRVLSLNVDDINGTLAQGSTFVANAVTLPFGAYVKPEGSALSEMPVFGTGELDNVSLPLLSASGDMTVETPGPGQIRICSVRDRMVTIYSMTGMAVRTLQLTAGEPVCIDNLTQGLYMAGGIKVLVK
ncbi:MAG: hypothetical protein K2K84_00885, partial [Muribaculaceae bacterium]|nr:hypothetical protein [Muribaculaceae bacterium]